MNRPNTSHNQPDSTVCTPTRHLRARERAVFDRVLSEFIHLGVTDAEMLTQYSETVIRYEDALKQTKKNPTITVPVINRATGNVTGEKIIRNFAFATLKETQTLVASLSRRLLIDPASTEKRQRLLTKHARSMAASEAKAAEDASALANLTEEQITAEMEKIAVVYTQATPEALRQDAIWRLTQHADTDVSDYELLA